MFETIDDKQRALDFTNETLEFITKERKNKKEIEYFKKKKEELEFK
jgi:hypothetical protein